MGRSWTIFVVGSVLLLADGAALADPAPSFGPGLRPFIHKDRHGRTLVDVCPERTRGQRRCHLQRILEPGAPEPVPLSGGPGSCGAVPAYGRPNPHPGSMRPVDVVAAYNIPSTASAAGAIVAIVDLASTNAMLDVNTYRAYFGIPALPACPIDASGVPTPALVGAAADGGTGTDGGAGAEGRTDAGTARVPCFARVGFDGTVNSVSSTNCPGSSQETSLDVEMVSAVCPDCSIVVVEAPSADGSLDRMSAISSPPSCPGGVLGATAVSTSWGGPEGTGDDDSYFACPTILTVVSAGDSGYMLEDTVSGKGAADFPASSPLVLAAGGTTLSPSGEQVWDDDGVWGGGGSTTSGCSKLFAMPLYQTTSGFSFGPCTMRAANDVAAAAEWNGSGGGSIAVFNTDSGGWSSVVGTSASSPLVAAILVRLGLGGKDQHALFYTNGGAFNDITVGNDDSRGICGGTVLCTAGKQWDGPTGLGTPNGARLLALAGGTLEPEPDAGAPDSGSSRDGGDGGKTEDSGSYDASSRKLPNKHPGAPCIGDWECAGQSQCVSPGGSKPPVCAPLCGSTVACPAELVCQFGYCFAGAPASDAGSRIKDQNPSSSGCACSAAKSGASWGAGGWMALAMLGLTRRRTRARPSRSG